MTDTDEGDTGDTGKMMQVITVTDGIGDTGKCDTGCAVAVNGGRQAGTPACCSSCL